MAHVWTGIWTLAAGICIAVFGWVIKIEPRLEVIEYKHKGLEDLIKIRLEDIKSRLERIERNQDADR
jgi:hypothetical protein